MQWKSPSETDSRLAGQEIPHILRNWFSLPCSMTTRANHWTLSWDTLIQSPPTHDVFNINFNIILPSAPRPPKWCHPFGSSGKNFTCVSLMRATCPTYRRSDNS